MVTWWWRWHHISPPCVVCTVGPPMPMSTRTTWLSPSCGTPIVCLAPAVALNARLCDDQALHASEVDVPQALLELQHLVVSDKTVILHLSQASIHKSMDGMLAPLRWAGLRGAASPSVPEPWQGRVGASSLPSPLGHC